VRADPARQRAKRADPARQRAKRADPARQRAVRADPARQLPGVPGPEPNARSGWRRKCRAAGCSACRPRAASGAGVAASPVRPRHCIRGATRVIGHDVLTHDRSGRRRGLSRHASKYSPLHARRRAVRSRAAHAGRSVRSWPADLVVTPGTVTRQRACSSRAAGLSWRSAERPQRSPESALSASLRNAARSCSTARTRAEQRATCREVDEQGRERLARYLAAAAAPAQRPRHVVTPPG
jgi:hypothetical protein